MSEFAVLRVAKEFPYIAHEQIRERLRYATFVNLKRRYMYFEVPKAGCTSLKTLIHAAENLPAVTPLQGPLCEVRRELFIHDRNQFLMTSLVDLDNETQDEVLNSEDFFRFTVVRNPYTRLESAWKDKVRVCAPGYGYFYQQIRGGIPIRFDKTVLINFSEFVNTIATHDLRTSDHHWRLQTEHLFLRAMNFTHIGRLEKIDDIITIFLERAGFSPDALPHLRIAMNLSSGGSAYNQQLADKVYNLYQEDFNALDYQQNDWKKLDDATHSVSEERYLEEIAERNFLIGRLYSERSELKKRLLELRDRPKDETSLVKLTEQTFDALYETYISPLDGWLSKKEAALLYTLAREVSNGCIVEVGSFRGRSATALALGSLAGHSVPIYAIDPHEPFTGPFGGDFGSIDRGHFMQSMTASGLFHMVRLLNIGSEFLAHKWPRPVGLLFIDGNHRYEAVAQDFAAWRSKLSSNAAVVFGDAVQPGSGPERLVRELLETDGFEQIGAAGKMICLRASLAPVVNSQTPRTHPPVTADLADFRGTG